MKQNGPFYGSPPFGSEAEREIFQRLQTKMRRLLKEVFPDPGAPRTVVVLPSLTLDQEVLAKITGVHYYEERMLCLLMLLRLPLAQVIFLSSQPISPYIIDYYLHLLPGVPVSHARERLVLFSCYDSSRKPLSEKILERPRLMERIQTSIRYPETAHLTCFNATELERTVSVRLSLPLYASDPELTPVGGKSGSRKLFREAGVELPAGVKDLSGAEEIAPALEKLKRENPALKRAVVKMNQGFSGEGNAIFSFEGAPTAKSILPWLKQEVPKRLRFEAASESWEHYSNKFTAMGGIVEEFIEGDEKTSPSVQFRIQDSETCQIISTHDQVLGGPSEQVFLGCRFPANEAYRQELLGQAQKVGDLLAAKGALGRAGVDFISVKQNDGWKHYAIEINLRKGGTTHTFLMLQYLVDGSYDAKTGIYRTPAGLPRYYYATDNLEDKGYCGLLPKDLIDIVVKNGLHFHSAIQEGVVFHLIGGLSEFGKLGVVCIGGSREKASQLFQQTKDVLKAETARYEVS